MPVSSKIFPAAVRLQEWMDEPPSTRLMTEQDPTRQESGVRSREAEVRDQRSEGSKDSFCDLLFYDSAKSEKKRQGLVNSVNLSLWEFTKDAPYPTLVDRT